MTLLAAYDRLAPEFFDLAYFNFCTLQISVKQAQTMRWWVFFYGERNLGIRLAPEVGALKIKCNTAVVY